MNGKGKSGHARRAARKAFDADLESRVSALERLVTLAGLPAVGLPTTVPVRLVVHPLLAFDAPGTSRLLGGGLFALTPLPRTMASGNGKSPCQGPNSSKTVYTFTEAERVACVVEATDECTCASVRIQIMRGAAIVGRSPAAEPGNTASFGPVNARAGDTVVVDCGGEGFGLEQCQYNWQVNRAA
jgi:hypothetical protein